MLSPQVRGCTWPGRRSQAGGPALCWLTLALHAQLVLHGLLGPEKGSECSRNSAGFASTLRAGGLAEELACFVVRGMGLGPQGGSGHLHLLSRQGPGLLGVGQRPPQSVGQALVWGMGHRDPEGESAGAACSPVLVSVDFPCFCPQPRFWLRWPCTVGVSLGPVQGPVHSQVEAVTPGCRLMKQVRWGGLGLLTRSQQMAFQCSGWPLWGLGAQNWSSSSSCPVRARDQRADLGPPPGERT